jgi:hypothetical protein
MPPTTSGIRQGRVMHSIATFSASDIQTQRISFGSFVTGDQDIVLRRYRADDREAVLDLLDEDEDNAAASRRNPFIVQSDPLDIEAIYRGRSRLWVALCHDEIIGVAGMQVSGGIARLGHLAVSQAWSGPRGVVVEHMRRKAMVEALSQGLGALSPETASDDADDSMEQVVSDGASPAIFQHGRQPSACVYHPTI